METEPAVIQQVCELMDEVRVTSLWFMPKDYYPQSVDQAMRVLQQIENTCDVATFRKAAKLRQWLSRNSNVPSAA